MHVLNRLAEPHRAGPLTNRSLFDLLRIVRERLGGEARPGFDARREHAVGVEQFAQSVERGGKPRGVVRTIKLQLSDNRTGGGQGLHHRLNKLRFRAQDHLVRTIVHRHEHLFAVRFHYRIHLVAGHAADGDQDAARNVGAADQFFHPEKSIANKRAAMGVVAKPHDARRVERDKLSAAVPDHRVGLDVQPGKQRSEAEVGRRHRLHRGLHFKQGGVLFLRGSADREHPRAGPVPATRVEAGMVHQIKCGAHFGKIHREIGQHVEVLRAFAGENKRGASLGTDAILVIKHAALGLDAGAVRLGKFFAGEQ